jgi:predicted DNA-binding transcriptional regulator AlpA
VQKITNLSRQHIHRLVHDEQFPKPLRLTRHAIRWWSADIKRHLKNK